MWWPPPELGYAATSRSGRNPAEAHHHMKSRY